MVDILLNSALAGIVACITHEGGHYLAALLFGKHLKFKFSWGKLFNVIPVPRWIWRMPLWDGYDPNKSCWKDKIVALAGFTMEFFIAGVAVVLGWLWLLLVASVHIIAYPFYAGESSDFKWL